MHTNNIQRIGFPSVLFLSPPRASGGMWDNYGTYGFLIGTMYISIERTPGVRWWRITLSNYLRNIESDSEVLNQHAWPGFTWPPFWACVSLSFGRAPVGRPSLGYTKLSGKKLWLLGWCDAWRPTPGVGTSLSHHRLPEDAGAQLMPMPPPIPLTPRPSHPSIIPSANPSLINSSMYWIPATTLRTMPWKHVCSRCKLLL